MSLIGNTQKVLARAQQRSAKMADSKRQNNAAGKVPVATPNMGPSGLVSLENALSGVIGAR